MVLISTSTLAHEKLDCSKCHDGALVKQYRRLQQQLGKDIAPGWDRVREVMPLTEADRQALSAKCADCHAQQAKDWAASGHALTYAQSFQNREHNRMEWPMDDCLRCHAMFFEGTAAELLNQIKRPEIAGQRSIPCVVCHQVHPEHRLTPTEPAKLVTDPKTSKAGFYDRREQRFFPIHELPVPKIFAGDKPLKLSDDPRIRVCYQCHAPSLRSAHQAGTSDDRTVRGVHEGLSCLDCHATHALVGKTGCAQCHPAISNCGLDVLRMDTTARAKGSPHDIHTVTCEDCHPGGLPKRKP